MSYLNRRNQKDKNFTQDINDSSLVRLQKQKKKKKANRQTNTTIYVLNYQDLESLSGRENLRKSK